MTEYRFITDCVGMPESYVDALSEMTSFDQRTEAIDAPEFFRAVGRDPVRRVIAENGSMIYDSPDDLARDWSVTFWKGWFGDLRCYFFDWSRIEYLFTEDGKWPERQEQTNE